jgi:dihydrodipicolinate synthase/N-acetylneuraminate lyase
MSLCHVNLSMAEGYMVTSSEYIRISREVVESLRHLQQIIGIFKNETRLSQAGIDFIHHAKAAGIKQSRIAEILEITPAAVTYHLR